LIYNALRVFFLQDFNSQLIEKIMKYFELKVKKEVVFWGQLLFK